ncbi:MAG: outer membrane insertion C- signal [Bacteroidota bacterium]
MKKSITKLLAVVVIVAGGILSSNAQELGVRFGDVSGGNVAIDAIFSTGEFNRLHADVSFGHGVGIDLLWDFLYRPLGGEAFNWYLGVGPYTRIGEYTNKNDEVDDFDLGATFEVGLEYRFGTVPIALGIDWRPRLEIIDHTDFHAGGFGLNVRYVFGN